MVLTIVIARGSRLFGAVHERQGKLGPAVRDALRAIAELDDDPERLASSRRHSVEPLRMVRAADRATASSLLQRD